MVPDLILWVKPECGVCREAEALMTSLSAALEFDWRVQEGAYENRVPLVATMHGEVLAEAPIAPAALARRIRELSPAAPD